jgi:hypothetical protein
VILEVESQFFYLFHRDNSVPDGVLNKFLHSFSLKINVNDDPHIEQFRTVAVVGRRISYC